MKETIDMETVRIIIEKQISFERELLETFIRSNSHFGIYGCEVAIRKLNAVLQSMEVFKTVEQFQQEIA